MPMTAVSPLSARTMIVRCAQGAGEGHVEVVTSRFGKVAGSAVFGHPVSKYIVLPFEFPCVGLLARKLRLSRHRTILHR